jgi:hypothetical protein
VCCTSLLQEGLKLRQYSSTASAALPAVPWLLQQISLWMWPASAGVDRSFVTKLLDQAHGDLSCGIWVDVASLGDSKLSIHDCLQS